MKTEYRVFNPSTGVYISYETLEEANQKAHEMAWEFFNLHCNQPIAKVVITDEGAEIWGKTE